MNKKQFETKCRKNLGISKEEYSKRFVTLRCNCGDYDCQGWACVDNDNASIQAHKDLFQDG